jgi:hypothetical protein
LTFFRSRLIDGEAFTGFIRRGATRRMGQGIRGACRGDVCGSNRRRTPEIPFTSASA